MLAPIGKWLAACGRDWPDGSVSPGQSSSAARTVPVFCAGMVVVPSMVVVPLWEGPRASLASAWRRESASASGSRAVTSSALSAGTGTWEMSG